LNLAFIDESGFSLMMGIAYTWFNRGKSMAFQIKTMKKKFGRLNIIGAFVINEKGAQLYYRVLAKNCNTDQTFAFLDSLKSTLQGCKGHHTFSEEGLLEAEALREAEKVAAKESTENRSVSLGGVTTAAELVVMPNKRSVLSSNKLTVAILDNASFHQGNDFEQEKQDWEDENFFLRYLPPYSPHLNLIEGVWKKIKGFLMPRRHYATIIELAQAMLNAFQAVGAINI
jgi:DDE superfamily endonuclease